MYLVPGGGVPGPGGVPGQVLPPCGQTDACKNITFATSLRTVIINDICLKLINLTDVPRMTVYGKMNIPPPPCFLVPWQQ